MTEQIQKEPVPHSTASLVLGILSVLTGWIIIGLILGIIGLVQGNKSKKLYNLNPGKYTGSGVFQAGRITSIIGIVFGVLYLLKIIISFLAVVGFLYYLSSFND